MAKVKEAAGYIFLCSNATEDECFDRSLFGGQEKYRNRVSGLKKGDILFTYNFQSKRLHGIFEAESELQKDIVPGAWNGEYPWQVKVKLIEDHPSISRGDIGKILGFSLVGFPASRLSQETVNALLKLFRAKKRVHTYDDSTPYTCKDGHKVRSLGEKKIDDWLFEHQILHAYEYPIKSAKYCDFYIPGSSGKQDIYIEYWGRTDKNYLKNRKFKTEIYKKHKLTLIEIEHNEVNKIDEILSRELKKLKNGVKN